MMRKTTALCVLVIICALSAGCWSRKEMNDIAIVTGLAVDKAGDRYLLSAQILNPGQMANQEGQGGGGTPVTTFATETDTIHEGIRKLTTVSPRKLYFAHIRIFVIGEELAKEGIRNVLDLLLRDHELRPDFYVAVAKGTKAVNILSTFTTLEKVPAEKLYRGLEVSQKYWSPSVGVHLDALISALISDGKQPALSGLEINGDKQKAGKDENIKVIRPEALLKYTSIGVFKEDRLVGWLNEGESRGYSFVIDNVSQSVGDVTCPDGGKLVIELLRAKTKLKGKYVGDTPEIDIVIHLEGNVSEVECKIDLSQTKALYELEKRTEQRIQKYVESVVHKVQSQYKSDIFGFGEAMHRDQPKRWKTVKKDWDQEFTKVKINPKIDVKLRRTGKIGKSFIQEMKND
ncbi:Ger(x)C family spore germination protein [Paenibacillus sp. MBLB4367]|uniref:Ger(x)C family spore germination protein n=1 Tax=Paenibacillus sp. MBLB4367 TaxID=3384767 RepID=UPI00390805B4